MWIDLLLVAGVHMYVPFRAIFDGRRRFFQISLINIPFTTATIWVIRSPAGKPAHIEYSIKEHGDMANKKSKQVNIPANDIYLYSWCCAMEREKNKINKYMLVILMWKNESFLLSDSWMNEWWALRIILKFTCWRKLFIGRINQPQAYMYGWQFDFNERFCENIGNNVNENWWPEIRLCCWTLKMGGFGRNLDIIFQWKT